MTPIGCGRAFLVLVLLLASRGRLVRALLLDTGGVGPAASACPGARWGRPRPLPFRGIRGTGHHRGAIQRASLLWTSPRSGSDGDSLAGDGTGSDGNESNGNDSNGNDSNSDNDHDPSNGDSRLFRDLGRPTGSGDDPAQQRAILDELAWRTQKVRLEEQNDRRFGAALRSRPRKLSYKEAGKWVRANLGADTREEFEDLVLNGNLRTPYIPKDPERYYTANGTWGGWEDFLRGG